MCFSLQIPLCGQGLSDSIPVEWKLDSLGAVGIGLPKTGDSLHKSHKFKDICKERFHGMAEVGYSYRTGDYFGRNIPKHRYYYTFRPDIQLGIIPINLNIGYASDYKGQLGNFYGLGARLDYQKLQQNLYTRASSKLKNDWLNNDSLLLMFRSALDTLPNLDSLKSIQFDYSGLLDSVDMNADTLPTSWEDTISGKYLDSIRHEKERIEALIAKVQAIQDFINELNLRRAEFSNKRAQLVSDAKNFKNRDLKQFTGANKFLYSFEHLDIGGFSLNYGSLFAKGGQFWGAHFVNGFNRFKIISFAGSTKQNSNFYRPSVNSNPGTSFKFAGGGVMLGNMENQSITVLLSKGFRSKKSDSIPSSFYAVYPKENVVSAVLFNKKIGKKTGVYGELAYSKFVNDQISPKEVENAVAVGSRYDYFQDNAAGLIGIRGEFKKTTYDINLAQTGADYYSFANPYQRSDQRLVGLKFSKSLWRSRLQWSGNYSYSLDNVSGRKSTSSSIQRYTNTLVAKFVKAPIFILSHTWAKVESKSKEYQYQSSYSTSITNLSITKVWQPNEKISLSHTGSWVNTLSLNSSKIQYQQNYLEVQNGIMGEFFSVQHSLRAIHILGSWSELANQIAMSGIIKKFKGGINYSRINRIQYQEFRNIVGIQLGVEVYKNIGLQGSIEKQFTSTAGSSFIIGNLSAQYTW